MRHRPSVPVGTFDTFWLAKQHFQHEGCECVPNALMVAVHLAYETERLWTSCGFNITRLDEVLRALARRTAGV